MQGNSVYVIAEAGVNHNGSLGMAKELVDVAAEAKADAVKFQTFSADKLVSKQTEMADYQKKNLVEVSSQHELLKKLELSIEDHQVLREHCISKGIAFLSTPFDIDSLHMLVNEFDVDRIKISSGDLTYAPLLLAAARTNKPVVISTGMATLGEVELALSVLAFGYSNASSVPSKSTIQAAYYDPKSHEVLKNKVTILQCTTEYPTKPEEVNLRAIRTLSNAFHLPVGFSDHTPGINAAIAAVALGVTVVEKHFTLDKTLPGPDHKASLSPEELVELVSGIRDTEYAMGDGVKRPMPSELKNRQVARKYIVAASDIVRGDEFTEKNLAIKRIGAGLEPFNYWDLLGQKASQDFSQDDAITLGDK